VYLEKKIFELKQEHKDIFHVNVGGEDFIFRPLTKYEYDEFVLCPDLTEDYIAEKVCEKCVLHPEGYDFYDPRYAGIPEALMDKIIQRSGFADEEFVENLLREYRQANQEDRHRQIENTIIGVFPEISLGDLDDMNVYEMLDLYSRAEWMINNLKRDLVHPEKVRMQREQQEQNQGQHLQQQAGQFNPQAQNFDTQREIEDQFSFKNDMDPEDMPDNWDVDPDKLQKQENKPRENRDDAPGMMNMQTLGGANMKVPKQSISNREFQKQQDDNEGDADNRQ